MLYPLRTGEERILDIVPGGTELGTQIKTGSRAGRTHILNNLQVEYSGDLLCVIKEYLQLNCIGDKSRQRALHYS